MISTHQLLKTIEAELKLRLKTIHPQLDAVIEGNKIHIIVPKDVITQLIIETITASGEQILKNPQARIERGGIIITATIDLTPVIQSITTPTTQTPTLGGET